MSTSAAASDSSLIATTITRRGFVKIGGALFVSALLPSGFRALGAEGGALLDPTLWLRGWRFTTTIQFWCAPAGRRRARG